MTDTTTDHTKATDKTELAGDTETANTGVADHAPSADDASAADHASTVDHASNADHSSAAASGPTPPNVADLEEALRDVVDPELGINVVDLGLIYGLTVDQHSHVIIDMTLTSAACPLTDVIEDQVAQALDDLVASHRINWVWMPPWGPDKITDDGREQLRALGFNV
jgi:metal-sulfur cluster biosynthetic enzyme